MSDAIELPTIEKGIPLPLPERTGDQRCGFTKSVWPDFLRGLEPGNSFVVDWPVGTHILNIGKWMGLKLIKAELARKPGRAYAQMWIWLVN